jgi:hypothetical protein
MGLDGGRERVEVPQIASIELEWPTSGVLAARRVRRRVLLEWFVPNPAAQRGCHGDMFDGKGRNERSNGTL